MPFELIVLYVYVSVRVFIVSDLVDESSLVGSLVVRIVGFQNGEDPRIAALKEVLDLFLPRCMQVNRHSLRSSTIVIE